jgi:hypothetical protein
MSNKYGNWILAFGLIVLLVSSGVACGKPTLTTYNNKAQSYSISYPVSWESEVTEDAKIFVVKSPSILASVRVDVIDPIPAQQAAQKWVMAMGTGNVDFALLENKQVTGSWNWYVSYDYDAGTGPFHGEAYFKTTADHTYKVDTAGDMEGYKTYPFASIVSSFKLD